jgi:hypothetical protein
VAGLDSVADADAAMERSESGLMDMTQEQG